MLSRVLDLTLIEVLQQGFSAFSELSQLVSGFAARSTGFHHFVTINKDLCMQFLAPLNFLLELWNVVTVGPGFSIVFFAQNPATGAPVS